MEGLLATCIKPVIIGCMYLMYVDESGDSGIVNSPTRYFILTGIVIHESRWHEALNHLIAFRVRMRASFGLLLKEEIHAGKMLSKPGGLVRIRKNDRLTIIRHLLHELATLNYINIINVRVDKQGKAANYNPFDIAWRALIQRFENTLQHRNFPDSSNQDEKGLIFCDETDSAALRRLYRKMRAFNPIPHMLAVHGQGYRQLPLVRVVEDPSVRNSMHSYFIQAADAAAFAAYQWYAPSSYVKKKGARNYFTRLGPVLCKVARPRHMYGVVEF
jgi:hypothetical protein